MKNKTPKFFFDASIKNTLLGIGINELYSDKSINYQYLTDGNVTSVEGEELAFNLAVEWAMKEFPKVHEYHFFTDNKMLYRKQPIPSIDNKIIELFWIPRELNSKADKLANIKKVSPLSLSHSGIKKINLLKKSNSPILQNIANYICNKYSLTKRLFLLEKIADRQEEKSFLKNMFKENVDINPNLVSFYSLVSSFLLKEEKPSCFRKISVLDGFKHTIKNKDIENKLKLVKF